MSRGRNPLVVLGAAVVALSAGVAACVLAIMLVVHTIG